MATHDALDRGRPQKLYCQLAGLLKSHIERGQWEVGSQIPTEEYLCRQYAVSKATVRLAIDELVSLGYLKKFQGKGTFVRRKKPEHRIALLTNLAEDGFFGDPSWTSRLLDAAVVEPPEDVRSHLNVGEDGECQYLAVLTSELGEPRSLRKTYLPCGLLPSSLERAEAERAAGGNLFEFVETRCGQKIHRVRQMIDVARAGDRDCSHLELAPGSQILRARHLCTSSGDVPIVFSESLYRTGARARTVEFERLTL